MKIVCLVKQVPRGDAIEFDEETKSLKREGVPLELNRFDAYAVAHAARLRDALGGEVVAMTMGPPQAEEALRLALALGADRCIHLSDRVFALADTIGTSRTLSMAIAKEGADLVLCGRKTLDSETWQVPPEVAARLGWPQATGVAALEPDGGSLHARRLGDEGEDLCELTLPAVCSIAAPPSEGWTPDAEPVSEADGKIAVWTAADLVPDVRPNDKRFGQTGSPTRVLAVHDVTPERAGERFDDPARAAERVRALLAEREPTPSEWEKPPRLGEKPGHSYDCWSVVELVEGRPARISLELLAKGRELAGKLGGRNVALLLGAGVEEVARELGPAGAEAVVTVDDQRLRQYEPSVWADALRQVLERERPHVLLIPATTRGRDYGPRAAGALELGMTGDCVDLGIDRGGRLIQFKPAYGGNIVSVIMGSTTPQLATVRPRMFEPLEPRDREEASVRTLALDSLQERQTRLLERTNNERAFELDEASAVVAIGDLGQGAVEPIGRLAGTLGAALGGDRTACEAGLVPRSRQLGLLGRAVAPRLYIAVEATGDFEHLTGSVKAGVVVALSGDPESPLLEAADIALAGRWEETLPPLVEALRGAI
ncbi:MAG TPA: FAD-binding protein [Gaiellaceae bacterium]